MSLFSREPAEPWYRNCAALERAIGERTPMHLVDVRTREEFDEGHIEGAGWIPYLEIGDRPPTGDRAALIVVYCHSGVRSQTAKNTLEAMGYTDVHNFGGIVHWAGPLVSADAERGGRVG